MRNARVFVSCGQRSPREIAIGRAVYEYFRTRGFEAYFAERVHSPDALTTNIFKFLTQSEYFVFIDFKRDAIGHNDFRGSLFVNQELAISTFLGIEGIGFCERGTKREGILEYHIYNAFLFDDGTEIIGILDKETAIWDKDSANEIDLTFDPDSVSRNVTITNNPTRPMSDWYHVSIMNRNKRKHAYNCMGYISRITTLSGKDEISLPSCELIWSGLGDFSVNIVGGTSREIDAFHILHREDFIRFQHRPLTTTNPKYQFPRLRKGDYMLEYTVLSENFANASKTFTLNFGGTYRDIDFR